MDSSMFALDIGVAVILCGAMIAYNLHFRKEILDMRVEDVFDVRRFARTANIAAAAYAAVAIAGLCLSVYTYPSAHWMTMALLSAFAVVDLVRSLLRVRQLRLQAVRTHSVAAAKVAPELMKAGLWMLLYTLLQAANLFYFA